MVTQEEKLLLDIKIEEPPTTWKTHLLVSTAIIAGVAINYVYYFTFTTLNSAIYRTAL